MLAFGLRNGARYGDVYLYVAPTRPNCDSILAGKHLRVFPCHHLVEIIPPCKEVVCARVHVPVKDLRARGIAQRAIGDQPHVRVVRFDGKIESQVVSYIGRVPTVLQSSPSFVFEAHTLSGLMYMCKPSISLGAISPKGHFAMRQTCGWCVLMAN